MKSKLTNAYALFWAALSGFLFLSFFSSNPPNGFSGAPGEPTCTNCHSSGGGTGNITIAGLPATITANTTYAITVTVNRTNATPMLGGFQMTALNASNQAAGTFSNAGPSSTIEMSGTRSYFEHNPAQFFGGGNSVEYTVDWTAPATGMGNITMYAAGLVANGNNGTSGDLTVTTTAVGMLTGGGGGVITVNVTGVNVSCFNGSNGSATANASGGGGGPYNFAWSNGGNTQTITNLTAGNYSVTVTNGAGGMGMGSITITQPSTPVSVSVSNVSHITCANPMGSATANASGGVGNYSYQWSNGNSGPTAQFSNPGTFTVTATDGNGCTSSASVTITANITPPVAEAGPNQQISCTTPTVVLNGTGSSVGPNFTYQWVAGSGGMIVSGANTLTPTVSAAATYTLTVTNTANGCTSSDQVTVTGNTVPPTANAGPDMQLTCTASTVTLNGAGSSSGANFSYLWTTTNGNIVSGANTATPTVNSAGTYTLLVTNTANNCTATDQAVVTLNVTMPTANAGPDVSLTCTTTQLQLNGTGSSTGANFTYLWTTSNGNIVSGATTLTPIVNQTGTYCLRVTNTTNGCSTTDCVTVNENTTPPIANAGSASPITCSTTSVTLNGSASSSGAGITYLWTTTNGNIVSGATTTSPVVNVCATYTLTVTNAANGCTATSSVTVTCNTTPPNADAGPSAVLNCNNASVVLNGSGSSQGAGFTYFWSGPGITAGGNTTNPTVNAGGTYIILVTNTANGCTASDNTSVTQTPALTAAIPVSNNITCNGSNNGNATAQGNGGNGSYTYNWSNGANGQQVSNLAAAIYTVTITDADNCTATATVTITQPAPLLANTAATGESAPGANDGTATANPTGGVSPYTYLWSNNATSQSIANLAPGNYSVTVTDANQCTAVETVTVVSSACTGFALSFAFTNPTCQGNANGSATVTPTGGTTPFTYAWTNGSTGATAMNLAAGTYTVTVSDNIGCSLTGNVTLTDPPLLTLSTTQQTNVACNGQATGAATLAAAGGTPGYTFAWSNGGSGASQTSLPAGNYLVTVTDNNGCTATTSVNIIQPTALTGSVTATGETAVGANNGTASINPVGGVAPYTYMWNNGAITSGITNLSPGEYCATVTDANGCTVSGCAVVTQFGCGATAAVISGKNVSCNGGNDGSAQITVTGFTDPLTFAWSNGGTGNTIGNLAAGVYSVTVTDANLCSTVQQITITEPPLLSVILLQVVNNECPGQSNGIISVDGNGGTPGYGFIWSNGSVNPTVANLAPGVYEVTLSDANNCTATSSFSIGVDPDTEPPMVLTQNITVNLDANGSVTITAAMVDGGSTDNCGIAQMLIDLSTFDCDDIGVNKVILAVADAANNCTFDSAFVTVLDPLAPLITCPENIQLVSDCNTTVEYPTPTATDNCPDTEVFLFTGLPSGAVFPNGVTSITWGADDQHGNTSFCTFDVIVESSFTAAVSFTEPTCHSFEDATATVTPSGGTAPYSFEWNDPANQTTPTATGLAAGEYTVFITDAAGCVTSAVVNITQPMPILILLDQLTNETGTNMNGAISVTVSGGTGGDFDYEWTYNGTVFSNEEDITGLSAGLYVLQAKDAAGCTVLDTFEVEMILGLDAVNLENRLRLYPNPVSGQLFLQLDLPQVADITAALYDVSGRPLQPAEQAFAQHKTFTFNLFDAAPGIYFARTMVDGAVIVKRFVVQR
jgi:hypothetical protein